MSSGTPGAVTLEEGGSLLRLVGEVDLDVVERLPARTREALAGVRVADVGGLTFLDSTGMHLLVVAAVAARGRGERLRLRGTTTSTAELVRLVGLEDMFEDEPAPGD